MFKIEEIPNYYTEDYKTLHHDIGIVRRSNGTWDLWFGQDPISKYYEDIPYLDIVDGDLVSATELHSLQVGIIISCLTSWNYLNRTGNPIYTEFGNKSYSLLKKNKGTNTRYKIKHFFIECLNRMRRVYSVEYLDVSDVANNPYIYKVKFKVLSVTNTLVDGEFFIDINQNKNTSILQVNYNHLYTSVSNPLFVECILRDEYGSFIGGELIYIYIRNDNDSKFKFCGVSEATDENGRAYITIPPNGLNVNTQIMFVFKGNDTYNPSSSKIVNIESVAYYIKSKYTYKTIIDENGEELEIIDKQILYIEDSNGNELESDVESKFRLGELLSDYCDLEKITLGDIININSIKENSVNNNILEYDGNESKKLYLVPTNEKINGTNKVYYNAYMWNGDDALLIYPAVGNPTKVELNTTEPNEVHFLINDEDNGLYEIDLNDGHLYYQIRLYDNEL